MRFSFAIHGICQGAPDFVLAYMMMHVAYATEAVSLSKDYDANLISLECWELADHTIFDHFIWTTG